jgi:hypothetical protein
VATFLPEDRSRILYHLGYPDAGAAASLAAGILGTVVLLPQVEKALELLRQESVPKVQRLLSQLDDLEARMEKAAGHVAAKALGKLELRADEFQQLTLQYDAWVGRLAGLLGTTRNPQDPRLGSGGGGGVNGTWTR